MTDIIEKFKKFEVNRTNDIIREILTNISKEYNINLDDLLYKYLLNSKHISNTEYTKSKSNINASMNTSMNMNMNTDINANTNIDMNINSDNKEQNIDNIINDSVPDKSKCHGKVKGDKQCSRLRKDGKYYCGTHTNNLPYGTYSINNNNDIDINDGDKKSVKMTFFKITYSGKVYFVDSSMDKVYKSLDTDDLNTPIGYIDANKKIILY